MRVCLAYPNKNPTYSETFIRNHMKHLHPEYELTGGQWPYLTRDHISIFKSLLGVNLIRAAAKNLSPGIYHRIYTSSLKDFLKENRIDIVLAEYGPVGAKMVQGCLMAAVPLVVHFHGYDAFHYDTLRRNRKPYLSLFRNARKIIVVSDEMNKQLISLGAPQSNIEKIPYGVDTRLFSGVKPFENDRVFISVGRFTEKKGPDKTILAFHKAYQGDDRIRLWIIGDGELLTKCMHLAAQLRLEAAVKFLGVRSPEEIAGYHKKAYCFVQHSMKSRSGDSEGLPNTILEAMSSGLPVISTLHAGISEAVQHGVNGYLVPEGDIDGMAGYMNKICEEPGKVEEMSRLARQSAVTNYNLEIQVEKLKNALTLR